MIFPLHHTISKQKVGVKYTQMFISVLLDFHISHFKTDFKTISKTIQMFLTTNTIVKSFSI